MRKNHPAAKVAFSAVLGAFSLIFVYAGAIAPFGSWGIVAVAGLFPAAAVISVGVGAGALCWAGTTVLAFLLIPDKFCVLMYGLLFGLYPVLKACIEKLRRNALGYVLKLLFFNAALSVLFITMKSALFASLPTVLFAAWLLYVAGNLVFLLYDYGMSRLIAVYIARFHRAGK